MLSAANPKSMAKALRSTLDKKGIAITHSESLEIVARQFGVDNWNVLAAQLAPRRNGGGVKIDPPSPVFRIFDEDKAKAFYIEYLDFTLDWEHRFEAGLPLYAQISRSDFTLHLSEHHGDASPGATVFVGVDNIRLFHRELTNKAYANLRPSVQELDWGLQMEVTDPFSNRIRFCEQTGD